MVPSGSQKPAGRDDPLTTTRPNATGIGSPLRAAAPAGTTKPARRNRTGFEIIQCRGRRGSVGDPLRQEERLRDLADVLLVDRDLDAHLGELGPS